MVRAWAEVASPKATVENNANFFNINTNPFRFENVLKN